MLKLFTPSKVKETSTAKLQDDIVQVAYLTTTLNKLQDRINLEQANFDARMVEQRALYVAEKEKLQKEVKELEESIKQKEGRLKELLIPIDGLKERAEEYLAQAQIKTRELLLKEEGLDEQRELLKDKLDELSEREAVIVAKERKIESKLKGIEEESELVSSNHRRLNEQISVYNKEYINKSKELEKKESAIIIREQRATEYLALRTKELDELERGLKDRREALEREFIRIKKQQNGR